MIRTDSERFCCMLMIVHVVERKANIKPTSQLLDFKCVDVVLAFPWTSSMIFSVWIHFCSTCSLPRPVSRLAFPGRCQSESEGSVRRIGVRLPANGWWFQIISMMVHVIYIYNILYYIYIYWFMTTTIDVFWYFDICSISYLDFLGNCNLPMCLKNDGLKPPAQLYPRCFFRWSFKCCTLQWMVPKRCWMSPTKWWFLGMEVLIKTKFITYLMEKIML